MQKLKLFKNCIILFVLIFISGMISVYKGTPLDWDFLNYHLYNPYAFLTGRLNIDFVPCGIQSYFNPVLDIPYFLMFKNFANFPKLVCFCQGIYWGLLAFLVFQINIFLLQKNPLLRGGGLFHPIIATVLGMTDAIVFALNGTVFNDIQIAFLILSAFFFLIKSVLLKNSVKRSCYISFSALLAGLALGFKFSFYFFVFLLIIICFYKELHKRKLFAKTFCLYFLFLLIGFLIADGYFAYIIYEKFGNPFFPYCNAFFKSDFFPLINKISAVDHFSYLGLKSLFINPFMWLNNPLSVSDQTFFDLKHIFAYVSVLSLLILTGLKKIKFNFRLKFLFIFVILSFFIWTNTTTVIRYFTPVLCLSGTLIVLFFVYILSNLGIKSIRNQKILFWGLLLISFIKYEPLFLEQTHGKITIPNLQIPNNSLVILAAQRLSFLIVGNNPNVEFVGICMEFCEKNNFTPAYLKYVKERIIQYKNIYVLTNKHSAYSPADLEKLFNLKITECKISESLTLNTNKVDYYSSDISFCKVEKLQQNKN